MCFIFLHHFRGLFINLCQVSSRAFSVSIEILMWFLCLGPFVWSIACIDLCVFLNLWDKANLIMVNDLFVVLLHLVYKYFIEAFCIYVQYRDWSVIFLSLLKWFFLNLIWYLANSSCLFCGLVWELLMLVLLQKSDRIQQWLHLGLVFVFSWEVVLVAASVWTFALALSK